MRLLTRCAVPGAGGGRGGGGHCVPTGVNTTGFQIWINVPSARKMDDPRYGTIGPESLPLLSYAGVCRRALRWPRAGVRSCGRWSRTGYAGGVTARLLAGSLDGSEGPFRTVQPVVMIDVTLPAGTRFSHALPAGLDNAMAFVHKVCALA